MGESEAIHAISTGNVNIEGVDLSVKKAKNGWCNGCFYNSNKLAHECPDLARHICCTGGNILIKTEEDGEIG